ncbi:serine hydrolase domain-containing protein [Solitalea koreensis]|nr:serine hydrolase domain-containing protein [Solitalea koreensis]
MKHKILLCSLIVSTLFQSCTENKPQTHQQTKICIEQDELSPAKLARIRKRIHADKKTYQIDTAIQKKVKREGFNGNVLVAQKGVVLYRKSFGFAKFDRKRNDTLRIDSKFQLASMSKTFTAAAVLLLYERKKLSLEDTVQKFFPEFPYPGIQIKMLLSHRSGLPYYAYAFDDSVRRVKTPPTNLDIIRWFKQSKPALYNSPNRSFAYNNTNFMLLASIVEKVSGKPFDQFLRSEVFMPLGMKNTWLSTTSNDSININRTQGHEGRRLICKDYYDNVCGDKGVYSTVDDLLKWYKALSTNCLLSKKTLHEAFEPRSFERKGLKNYGYGFRMLLDEDQKHAKYIYHNGWWKGYSTLFWFSPQDDYVIIILSNCKNGTVYRIKSLLKILEEDNNVQNIEEDITD